MPHIIKVAAVQMDANPAPTNVRLERAERLVAQASQIGAQLIVLPELFNSGYGYQDENYSRAEKLNGATTTWMQRVAARYHIHLAGSLMLLEGNDIYNALLLFAPGGQMWRYDKNYPWGWERGYFRERRGITIAKTDLGDLGLMICWDAAHLDLWKRYAGQVDMMVISSCPPDVSNPTFHLPNGTKLTFSDFGTAGASMKGTGRLVFGDIVNQQTAWLGVPAVNTVGTGHIQTEIPNGFLSLASFALLAPGLIRYLPQANRAQLACGFIQGCKIVDAQGRVLTELEQEQGEAFTVAEVCLPEKKLSPSQAQPKSPLPKIAYLAADLLLPLLSTPVYRRGLHRLQARLSSH